jgi:hypothetical protein
MKEALGKIADGFLWGIGFWICYYILQIPHGLGKLAAQLTLK